MVVGGNPKFLGDGVTKLRYKEGFISSLLDPLEGVEQHNA